MSKSKTYALRLLEGEIIDTDLKALIQYLEDNPKILEEWRTEDQDHRIDYRGYSGRKATPKSLVIKRALMRGLKLIREENGV